MNKYIKQLNTTGNITSPYSEVEAYGDKLLMELMKLNTYGYTPSDSKVIEFINQMDSRIGETQSEELKKQYVEGMTYIKNVIKFDITSQFQDLVLNIELEADKECAGIL